MNQEDRCDYLHPPFTSFDQPSYCYYRPTSDYYFYNEYSVMGNNSLFGILIYKESFYEMNPSKS